jgi:hypothetical protein
MPSINRMVKILTPEEQTFVNKQKVIMVEEDMLTMLCYDFNFVSPLSFLERYLRISNLQCDYISTAIAVELLKLAASQMSFIDSKPSIIAVSALLLALNISS